MGTRIIKTAGQVAFEGLQGELKTPMPWDNCSIKAAWEAFAAKHNIQPLTEEVPEPPTDGQLLVKAYDTSYDGGNDAIAAEFLRLRAERDGTSEPLPVTEATLNAWWDEYDSSAALIHARGRFDFVAERINQHRGVRPVPQVTAATVDGALAAYVDANKGAKGYQVAADYINAELAKSATTATAVPDDERSTRLARLCLDLRDAVNKYHHDRLQSSLDEVSRLAGFCNTPAMLKDAYPLPMKVAGCVVFRDVLYTFETVADMELFRDKYDLLAGSRVVGHEHHPRKDGTP